VVDEDAPLTFKEAPIFLCFLCVCPFLLLLYIELGVPYLEGRRGSHRRTHMCFGGRVGVMVMGAHNDPTDIGELHQVHDFVHVRLNVLLVDVAIQPQPRTE
jgi:hypothetical protein